MSDKFKIPNKMIEDVCLFEQKKIVSNHGCGHKINNKVTFFSVIHAMVLFLSIIVSSVMFRYVSQSKQSMKNHSFLHEATTQGSAMEVLKCNL